MSQISKHAKRLRELADNWRNPTTTAAALLAGAEALEAVEVAKPAFRLIQSNRIGDGGRCEFSGQTCVCSECTATAALARLEGK